MMSHTRSRVRRAHVRVQAAAALAGLLALTFLVLAASLGAVRADGGQHGTVTVTVTDVPPECARAGSVLALCMQVAARGPYEYTAPGGATVGVPDGRAMLRGLDERPGTAGFARAVRALDAEWRTHR